MRTELIDAVIEVIHQEENAALLVHPLFNSTHEGKAVIEEELDESKQELMQVQAHYNALWESIKANDKEAAAIQAAGIYEHAISLACEVVQVAAMASKYLNSPKCR